MRLGGLAGRVVLCVWFGLGGLRAQQCVWPCRSHSEADGPPGAAFSARCLTLLAIFNLTPSRHCFATSVTTFLNTGVPGGLAHHEENKVSMM